MWGQHKLGVLYVRIGEEVSFRYLDIPKGAFSLLELKFCHSFSVL